jgi:nicotinamide-nucleotide amidase
MRRKRSSGPTQLRASVIAVGDELLNGFIINTNAAWLGRALAEVGVSVVAGTTVGDDVEAIAAAIADAAERVDVVVVSGGLGPTSDDRTRAGLAKAAGVDLLRHAEAEDALRTHLSRQGREPLPQHLVQVDLPAGATPLTNSAGSAPGIRMAVGTALVFALPGPPRELHAVAESGMLPELRRRGGVVRTRSLRTALIPESEVAALVAPIETAHPHVTVAYLAAPAEVVVRLTVSGVDQSAIDDAVDAAAEDVREALGDAVVGNADQTLAQAVVGLLAKADRTVAVAESLTGGAVAASLTDVVGASTVLRGGVVAYTVDAKRDVLGVDAQLLADHGPVHAGVARDMAQQARERFGADYGLATTGVAGPDPHAGAPVGLVHVAVAGPFSSVHVELHLHGDRDSIRRQSVVHALDLLRRTVLGLPPHRRSTDSAVGPAGAESVDDAERGTTPVP